MGRRGTPRPSGWTTCRRGDTTHGVAEVAGPRGSVWAVEDELREFGKIFTRFLHAAMEAEADTDPEFGVLVREHL